MHDMGSKHRRRLFFILGSLSLAILVGLRHYAFEEGSSFAGVDDHLIASLVEALLLLTLALYLWPPGEATHELRPREIRQTLLDGVSSTKRIYWFRGRTARFLSATVLPSLVRQASSSLRSLEVRVQLLDPSSVVACGTYADYRRKIGEGLETTREMQLRVLAHLVAIHIARSISLVDIHIFVNPAFSLFRLDINDEYVVVTRERKSEPGLKVATGSPFYELIIEDFRLTEKQSRQLASTESITRETLSTDTVQRLIASWEFTNMELSPDELNEVVTMARAPHDPYA